MLSSLSSKNNISKFVHLSALGIEDGSTHYMLKVNLKEKKKSSRILKKV